MRIDGAGADRAIRQMDACSGFRLDTQGCIRVWSQDVEALERARGDAGH